MRHTYPTLFGFHPGPDAALAADLNLHPAMGSIRFWIVLGLGADREPDAMGEVGCYLADLGWSIAASRDQVDEVSTVMAVREMPCAEAWEMRRRIRDGEDVFVSPNGLARPASMPAGVVAMQVGG